MKCKKVRRNLPSLWENSLETTLAEEVRRHLGQCENCQEEWKQLGTLMADIEAVEEVQPDPRLRKNFFSMLEEAKSGQREAAARHEERTLVEPVFWKQARWIGSMAAGLALLLGGFWMGRLQFFSHMEPTTVDKGANQELEALQGQIESMKQMMAVYMMDQRSASKRIQAVSYTDEISELSPDLLKALLERLNQDDNVNVRLASLNALTRFAHQESVRASLVDSLPRQTNPVMQIMLINLMVEMDEKRARGSIQELLESAATPLEVKNEALQGLGQLL